jgi:LemA protein
LSRLLVTVEAYPELKANQNFLKLQDELASTENTIQTARVRFNESVEFYNNHVLKFPNNLFLGKYKEKPYFDAEPGSDKAPEVKF